MNDDVLDITEKDAEEEIKLRIRSALNCTPDEFYEKYEAYKKAEAEFKNLYEPFKANLLNLYKDDIETLPKAVILGGAKLIYVSPSIRSTIDSKKLKEEEPELAKKYTKTTNVAATIRLEGI